MAIRMACPRPINNTFIFYSVTRDYLSLWQQKKKTASNPTLSFNVFILANMQLSLQIFAK